MNSSITFKQRRPAIYLGDLLVEPRDTSCGRLEQTETTEQLSSACPTFSINTHIQRGEEKAYEAEERGTEGVREKKGKERERE